MPLLYHNFLTVYYIPSNFIHIMYMDLSYLKE